MTGYYDNSNGSIEIGSLDNKEIQIQENNDIPMYNDLKYNTTEQYASDGGKNEPLIGQATDQDWYDTERTNTR